MQVEELYDLTSWIDIQLSDIQIASKYKKLHEILSNNSRGQQQQPFENEKSELFESLGAIAIGQLSNGQMEILETIGVAQYLGARGVAFVEDTLYKNSLDTSTAASKMEAAANILDKGIEWSKGVRSSLEEILDTSAIFLPQEKALMRIHFTRDAHLSNVTDFKEWGKTWYEIGRGISVAQGHAPEDVQIIGASKGSIILTLASVYGVAKTMGAIVMDVLKLVEKIHQIRKTAEEVRALKIANEQAEQIAAKATEEKQMGVDAIAQETVESLGLNPNQDGDRVAELKRSVKLLADFLDKGGEVDFQVPDEGADPDPEDPGVQARQELRDLFSEVRRLESEVKQLEYDDLDT